MGDRTEWVRQQVERLNAGDVDGFLDSVGPTFEFTPDPSLPDAGSYRGEELRRWMHDWVGARQARSKAARG